MKRKPPKPRKCIVHGCMNYSDAGRMIGVLCGPCHEMITTGVVHPQNPTFIGDMKRAIDYCICYLKGDGPA